MDVMNKITWFCIAHAENSVLHNYDITDSQSMGIWSHRSNEATRKRYELKSWDGIWNRLKQSIAQS